MLVFVSCLFALLVFFFFFLLSSCFSPSLCSPKFSLISLIFIFLFIFLRHKLTLKFLVSIFLFFLISQEIGSPISLLIPPPPAQPFYCNEIAPCSWWQYQEDNPWRNKFNIKLSVNSMRKEGSWRLDNSLYFTGIKHRVICPGLSITQAEKRKRENYGE